MIPLPLTQTLLAIAAIVAIVGGIGSGVVAAVALGAALANELVRASVEYKPLDEADDVPSERQKTPIVYVDGEGAL